MATAVVGLAVVPARSPATDTVRSLSDIAPVQNASAGAAAVAALKPVLCKRQARGRAPRSHPAGRAIKAGRALLARRKGRARLRRALRAKALHHPARAETAAMGAVGSAKPGAALAATLAGLAAHPHDVTLWSNASVLLTELGRPKDGLSLAAAALRRSKGHGPMGIDRRALSLNNRAFALLGLHRYHEAVKPLRQAIAREPLLAEARRNLVLALMCSGQDAAAASAYADSQHRRADLATVPVTTLGEPGSPPVELPGSTQPKVGDVLDLSHGEQGSLPALTVPPDPRAGVASADALDQLFQQRSQLAHDLTQQSIALSPPPGALDPVEFLRIATIGALYSNWLAQRPDLAAGFQQIDALRMQMDAMYADTWTDKVPGVAGACTGKPTQQERDQCLATDCRSAIDAAHDSWLPVANQANALVHQWGPDLFNYGTAVAANIRNQPSHDALVLLTRSQVWGTYAVYVIQRVAAWAGAEHLYAECIEPPTTAEAETGQASEPPGIACPPQLDTLPISVNIGVVKLTVNCESISATTGTPGPVGAFGSVGYSFKSAQTTAFVGLRGGADQIPGFDVGAKGGIYMTWDAKGNPTDCGLRATGSAGTVVPLDLGPSATGKVEVSLAGAFL